MSGRTGRSYPWARGMKGKSRCRTVCAVLHGPGNTPLYDRQFSFFSTFYSGPTQTDRLDPRYRLQYQARLGSVLMINTARLQRPFLHHSSLARFLAAVSQTHRSSSDCGLVPSLPGDVRNNASGHKQQGRGRIGPDHHSSTHPSRSCCHYPCIANQSTARARHLVTHQPNAAVTAILMNDRTCLFCGLTERNTESTPIRTFGTHGASA